MNILMISPMYPSTKDPVYGTFIKTYYDNFLSLCRDGHVSMVCIRGKSRGTLDKVLKYLVFYLEIIYRLLFKNYDVVYVHTITTPILPVKFASLFRHHRIVFNVHGSDVVTVKKTNEILKNMAIPLLYKACLIVAPSCYFKKVVEEMLPGFPESRIIVSPSGGVDIEKFSPRPTNNKVVTFGFVSRIDYGKGWDTFIEALSLLKKKGYIVRGIIAGRGAEEMAMLKMVNVKDVEDIIEYVGPVPHDKLPSLFRKLDAFVFPTRRSESLGLVGVEALACGIPVVGSNYAALPEYIKNGYNGFLFNHNDEGDLCDKLASFIKLSGSERERLSLNARQSSLPFETMAVMKSLYEKLKCVVK